MAVNKLRPQRWLLLVALLLGLAYLSQAQIEHPVSWNFSTSPAGADGMATLTLTATVQGPRHIYSQFIAAGGPEHCLLHGAGGVSAKSKAPGAFGYH
jgi:hypothetical protein